MAAEEDSCGGFRNDPKTFERLYRELAPKLVSYLVANGSDYATAGDLAQETFLRLWKRREDLTDDASQISAAAKNTAAAFQAMAESSRLLHRRAAFRDETATRKAVHLVMVSAAGLAANAWAHDVAHVVTLADFFS